ncbi:MAG TPA: elongation factor P [Candidatus Marinimicrobia bacterium]|nr:elongation factor P [Candidatus Neomarinimicrobiota bacterium]MDP6142843.1 elongation factor P [Candidatus Neomarinimicrobiota bacterium]MDP6261157.1 elongation factor P [Candidatus Neomarinimicrobiota bacterium]MDP7127259.1 elongation factor P [Candidatus Neomarinimicrobiota bacterium]MDP7337315.1 elongation factor P [Candidatus Neomarinimicrobiota bacterium]
MGTTAEIRNNAVLLHKGKRMKVLEFQHVKPGKGGAFVRTKLKDIQTGKIIDETFNAGARIEIIRVEVKPMQYLYNDGDFFIFMDNKTYDQITVSESTINRGKDFLVAGMNVDLLFDGQEILDIRIPAHVVLQVTDTEPGFKGNTATGATKPATLETGFIIQVPLFVSSDDKIKIDTRTGRYIERAK